jgi:radical SAM superfamily enzyme YgiQ (UPF0313 family)
VKRVLITHPHGPYAHAWGRNIMDLLDARLARGHGIYGMRGLMRTFALYVIAENITNPATVLEFPTWDDFMVEVKKGYDVIAIQAKPLYIPKVTEMVRAIKKHSPQSEIVIGGYGVMVLEEDYPWDTEKHGAYIRENADHFCRTEGVRFMRELLGDEPVDRPITQYHVPPTEVSIPNIYPFHVREPNISVGLGCPNGCNFCVTSAFFKQKKIYLADPAQVYDTMKYHQKKLGAKDLFFTLYDEDLFTNPDYVRELGRLIRSDKSTWGFRYYTFGSMRGVSAFEPEELRACGVGMLWIGVETGITEDGKSKCGYAKRNGTKTVEEVFTGLHSVGIATIGSMILGFDFHTPENLLKDIDYFVSLKPTFYQIMRLVPCPGTALYNELEEQKRLLKDQYKYENVHIWAQDLFELKNFSTGEMKDSYDLAHRELAQVNGPPFVQIFDIFLNAYELFHKSPDPFLRYQAKTSRNVLRIFAPFLDAIQHKPPSEAVARRITDLKKRAKQVLGSEPLPIRAAQGVASQLFKLRMDLTDTAKLSRTTPDPETRWTYFNQPGQAEPVIVERNKSTALPEALGPEKRSPFGALRFDHHLLTD